MKEKQTSNASNWAFVMGGPIALTCGSSRAFAGELQDMPGPKDPFLVVRPRVDGQDVARSDHVMLEEFEDVCRVVRGTVSR